MGRPLPGPDDSRPSAAFRCATGAAVHFSQQLPPDRSRSGNGSSARWRRLTIHDFQTDQRLNQAANPAEFSYENYVDRQDVNGGLDVGYDVGKKTFLVARLSLRTAGPITRPNPANTAFTTALTTMPTIASCLAWKAVPAPWLKLAVLGGPDIRDWAPGTPAGFDRNRQVYWGTPRRP